MNTEYIEDKHRFIWRIEYNYKQYAGIYEIVGRHKVDKTGYPKIFIHIDNDVSEPQSTIPFNGTIEEYLLSKDRQDVIESNDRLTQKLLQDIKRINKEVKS